MFQSLFARDFPPAPLYVSARLILNAQNAVLGGSRLENDVPFKLPGTRHGRQISSRFGARGDRQLLLVRLQPLLVHDNRTARDRKCESTFMDSSTHDKAEGTAKEAVGKVKEKTGKAIGNQDLEDRGTAEKVGGKVERKVGDVKKVFGK
jgi:uncharacterized protein YjbJ (UPF0337 family)